ncbi:DUF6483 family protein [Paenibacillus sp. KN14-4R]|uniref:DUF6483 family protein n=1 Tax=Paenibacillus sp. KN14-4R TaxID=3445773 RepID=UPI003FA14E64
MFRSDYLMRQIEQLTKVVGEVMGLRKEQKPIQAQQTIDEFLKRNYGITLNLLRSLQVNELVKMFTQHGVLDTDRLTALAKLLQVANAPQSSGAKQAEKEQEDHHHNLLKALHLHLICANNDEPEPEIIKEIDAIISDLRSYVLPIEIGRLVWAHYEQQGRYAQAEDILFAMLVDDRSIGGMQIATLVEDGLSFYERLLALDNDQLDAGNLPRTEIEASLIALKKWQ